MKRRKFIINSSLLVAGTTMLPQEVFASQKEFISRRPKLADRKFVSKEVERIIKEMLKNAESDSCRYRVYA